MYYTPSVMRYLLALTLTMGSHQLVLAVNENTPCVQGECYWNLPSGSGSSGTMKIWGSTESISDTRPVAGWQVLQCEPVETELQLMLTCADPDLHCDHMFQGGVHDTIVRISDDCGSTPFARVARYWNDQSNTTKSSAVTARASDADVHYLAVDTNFSAIDPSSNRNVTFALIGVNTENGVSDLRASDLQETDSSLERRRFGGLHSHVERKSIFHKLLDKLKHLTSFNKTISDNLQLFNYSGKHDLVDVAISCAGDPAPFTADVDISLDGTVQTGVSIGVVAVGRFIPPAVHELALALGVDGHIDALFNISARLTGTVSTGSIPIFDLPVGGFNFPPVITIGPDFSIEARMDFIVSLNALLATVHVVHDFNKVTATYPQTDLGGSFSRGHSHLIVSAAPNFDEISTSAAIQGHLIPKVSVGIKAFEGIAGSATVFMSLDASVGLMLTWAETDPPVCLAVDTKLALNLGAEGSVADLGVSATVTPWTKDYPLWKHCLRSDVSESTRNRGGDRGGRALHDDEFELHDFDMFDDFDLHLPISLAGGLLDKRQAPGLVCPSSLDIQVGQLVNVGISRTTP